MSSKFGIVSGAAKSMQEAERYAMMQELAQLRAFAAQVNQHLVISAQVQIQALQQRLAQYTRALALLVLDHGDDIPGEIQIGGPIYSSPIPAADPLGKVCRGLAPSDAWWQEHPLQVTVSPDSGTVTVTKAPRMPQDAPEQAEASQVEPAEIVQPEPNAAAQGGGLTVVG
jgi:hypothetical protein